MNHLGTVKVLLIFEANVTKLKRMFTGIIEAFGTVKSLEKESTNLHITLESDLAKKLKIDQSTLKTLNDFYKKCVTHPNVNLSNPIYLKHN